MQGLDCSIIMVSLGFPSDGSQACSHFLPLIAWEQIADADGLAAQQGADSGCIKGKRASAEHSEGSELVTATVAVQQAADPSLSGCFHLAGSVYARLCHTMVSYSCKAIPFNSTTDLRRSS